MGGGKESAPNSVQARTMDRPNAYGRSLNGPSSRNSMPGAGNFARQTILGDRKEVVDEVLSIGPSGIVGYDFSASNLNLNTIFNNSLTDIVHVRSSREVKKKKQVVIPLSDSNFGNSDDPTLSSAAPEPYIPKELREDPNEAQEKPKVVNAPRKDPYEGTYGLITPGHASTKSTSADSAKKAPLLARSRPKGWRELQDEDEKLKFELSARPEEDSTAYDRVAIEDFGTGMLLGMGWRPGKNDGADVVEYVRRPERLGLGATPKALPPGSKKSGASAPHMEYRDEQGRVRHVKPADATLSVSSKFFADGTRITIAHGPHSGMHGRVRRLSSDETEYIVDLDNDEQVRARIKECELYNPSSKKRGGSDSHHLDEQRPEKRYKTAEVVEDAYRRDDRNDRYGSSSQGHSRDSNYRENNNGNNNYNSHSERGHGNQRPPVLWVTPHIRVKVSSKRFKDGKYYCKKGIVEDIVSGTRCAVRLDDGLVLDDIDQSDLETVIPPVGGRVMVVRGDDIGVRGILREKNNDREVVYVQIEGELDVLKFNMDDVSEYV